MEKKEFRSLSHLPLKEFYSAEDSQPQKEKPGEFPFTRGLHQGMYRGRTWTMRQYSGFGSANETNKRFLSLLQKGQTGLSVAFDLPTQMGFDSDHAMASGEVGKVGVAIDSLQDMQDLFNNIPLEKVSTSMTINSTAAILLCYYICVAKKQGADVRQIRGTIQNDILKEYIARGTYIYPPTPSLRITTDIFDYCKNELPKWNTISISGYHIREAGSDAVQEVAFTLANALTYVDAAIKKGLKIDEFAPRLSFFFNVHNDFLEEVAKFRAARRLWANLVKERFQAQNPKSLQLRFHTQTAGCSLTAQQPKNNIVRVAYQALAAVLGGTQSLHTNSLDEALGLPTEESATIALRTQQIIANETGVKAVADPLGGSYYIEHATERIYNKSKDLIEHIENKGGVIKCIENGWLKAQILESSLRYQKELESKESIIVGVNEFEEHEEQASEVLKVSKEAELDQVEKLRRYKQSRDTDRLGQALSQVKQIAESSENIVPSILVACENGATVGEISDVLRSVFGEYQEVTLF
jgi:methylmalonyl-CoA mutase N-terminal domain/subunit